MVSKILSHQIIGNQTYVSKVASPKIVYHEGGIVNLVCENPGFGILSIPKIAFCVKFLSFSIDRCNAKPSFSGSRSVKIHFLANEKKYGIFELSWCLFMLCFFKKSYLRFSESKTQVKDQGLLGDGNLSY